MSDTETDPDPTAPQPYDHYRAGERDPLPAGTYRVVGTGSETADAVTLLAVTDADGRRANIGRIERVDRETLAGLAPVDGPEDGPSVTTAVVYTVRAVPENLAARPAQVALGLAFLAVALVGPGTVEAPALAFEVANALAALLLAAAAVGFPR